MSLKVMIEHCINCDHHRWCSLHDQKKYLTYFEELKNILQTKISNVEITSNSLPKGYRQIGKDRKNNKYIDQKTAQTVVFPRLGAFEVEVEGILIYSKLHSSCWPNYDYIVEKIQQMRKDKESGKDLSQHELKKNVGNKQSQRKLKRYENYLKNSGSSPNSPRRTHYSNGKSLTKNNDLYVAQVTKIYRLNNNVPTQMMGKRRTMPKMLTDDLSKTHRNKSDLIELKQQIPQESNKRQYLKRANKSHYNQHNQIKGIEYLQLSPFEIARRKRKSSQKKSHQHNQKERNNSKDIIINSGIYYPQMMNRNDQFQNLFLANNPQQNNIRIVRQLQRLEQLQNNGNNDPGSLQKEVMNILKEEQSKEDKKIKFNPRDLLKKKMALKKAGNNQNLNNHKTDKKETDLVKNSHQQIKEKTIKQTHKDLFKNPQQNRQQQNERKVQNVVDSIKKDVDPEIYVQEKDQVVNEKDLKNQEDGQRQIKHSPIQKQQEAEVDKKVQLEQKNQHVQQQQKNNFQQIEQVHIQQKKDQANLDSKQVQIEQVQHRPQVMQAIEQKGVEIKETQNIVDQAQVKSSKQEQEDPQNKQSQVKEVIPQDKQKGQSQLKQEIIDESVNQASG